jgi:hypothetical protein
VPIGQDQEAAVVGDQFEPAVLVPEVPSNPLVARGALERRGREAQQRDPFLLVGGDVPDRVADLRQIAQVVVLRHQLTVTRLFTLARRAHANSVQIDLHLPFIRGQTRFVQLCYSTTCFFVKLLEGEIHRVAEVLRHRSQDSTAIYAKVSFEALRGVARAWPTTGGA